MRPIKDRLYFIPHIIFIIIALSFNIFGIYVHECIHKMDFQEMETGEGKICLFNCGSFRAYYDFQYNSSNISKEEIKKMISKDEVKAHLISDPIILVGFFLSYKFVLLLTKRYFVKWMK